MYNRRRPVSCSILLQCFLWRVPWVLLELHRSRSMPAMLISRCTYRPMMVTRAPPCRVRPQTRRRQGLEATDAGTLPGHSTSIPPGGNAQHLSGRGFVELTMDEAGSTVRNGSGGTATM